MRSFHNKSMKAVKINEQRHQIWSSHVCHAESLKQICQTVYAPWTTRYTRKIEQNMHDTKWHLISHFTIKVCLKGISKCHLKLEDRNKSDDS